MQENPAVEAEGQVKAALDDLVVMGALQKTNRMDIELLLNPEGQSTLLMEMSDQEIYQVVMDAVDACENIHINGTDDINDIQSATDPHPTHHDVLKVVSTIRQYVKDLNEPISQKLEALLASFNMNLCVDQSKSMKSTVLTNFFHKLECLIQEMISFDYNIQYIFLSDFFRFFSIFWLIFWPIPRSPYSPITHTLASPPRGMGSSVIEQISFHGFLNLGNL